MTDESGPGRRWDLENYKVGKEHKEDPFAATKAVDDIDGVKYGWSNFAGGAGPATMGIRYNADGSPLFPLALWTSLLSIVTLGIYRFWMIARLRRHYWNSIRFQGDPLEYTGTGTEKLLGFLVAIIFLSIYLGLFQLILTFVGLSYFDGNQIALQLSFLAVLPFLFWATYRGRQYIAARTRWRSIRFGMDSAAWGYTGRALALSLLTLITGGLAYPYQHFKLSKYMIDRTYFGDLRFEQHGSWMGLMGLWIWIYIAIVMMGLIIWGAMTGEDTMSQFLAGIVIAFGYVGLFYLYLRYHLGAVRYLWDNRTLGDASFDNDLNLDRTVWAYLGGTIMVGLITTVAAIVLFMIFGGAIALSGGLEELMALATAISEAEEGASPPDLSQLISGGTALIGGILVYLVIIGVSYAATQSFLIQPILRRQVEATKIRDASALLDARQRERDEATEAGGFADALGIDVGVGI